MVVLEEVARIKAGGKISDIKPEVRAVIENLVGYRYEECWGNNKVCQKMFTNIDGKYEAPITVS